MISLEKEELEISTKFWSALRQVLISCMKTRDSLQELRVLETLLRAALVSLLCHQMLILKIRLELPPEEIRFRVELRPRL